MDTTVKYTEGELAELIALTQCIDPAAAIRKATDEYIRYQKRLQLIEASGQVEMIDNWRELEQAELDDNPCGPHGDR